MAKICKIYLISNKILSNNPSVIKIRKTGTFYIRKKRIKCFYYTLF